VADQINAGTIYYTVVIDQKSLSAVRSQVRELAADLTKHLKSIDTLSASMVEFNKNLKVAVDSFGSLATSSRSAAGSISAIGANVDTTTAKLKEFSQTTVQSGAATQAAGRTLKQQETYIRGLVSANKAFIANAKEKQSISEAEREAIERNIRAMRDEASLVQRRMKAAQQRAAESAKAGKEDRAAVIAAGKYNEQLVVLRNSIRTAGEALTTYNAQASQGTEYSRNNTQQARLLTGEMDKLRQSYEGIAAAERKIAQTRNDKPANSAAILERTRLTRQAQVQTAEWAAKINQLIATLRAENAELEKGDLRITKNKTLYEQNAATIKRLENNYRGMLNEAARSNVALNQNSTRALGLSSDLDVLTRQIVDLNEAYIGGRVKADAYSKELDELGVKATSTGGRLSKLVQKLKDLRDSGTLSAEATKRVNTSLVALQRAENAASKSLNRINSRYANMTRATQLSFAASTLLNDAIFRLSPALGILTNQMIFTTEGFGKFVRAAGPIVAAASTLIFTFRGLKASLSLGAELETLLADVRKTTNLSQGELTGLTRSFQAVANEMPVTTKSLLEMAKVAGQLGITGGENIQRFTVAIAKLAIATDVVGEEGATSLARFLQALGTGMNSMGLEAERVSNILNELENTTAAVASEILAMTSYTQGLASQAGLTSDEILGMNAALLSLGVKAEAGGSAVVRAMGKVQRSATTGGSSLSMFAQYANMTSQEFRTLAEESPIDAFMALIKGLNGAAASGQSLNSVLTELGINEVRERRALLALAQGYNTLESAMATAREQSFLMNSVQAEVNIQSGTLASKILMLQNRFVTLGQRIGEVLVPIAKALVDVLIALVDNTDLVVTAIMGLGTYISGTMITALVRYIATLRATAAAAAATAAATGAAATATGALAAVIAVLTAPLSLLALAVAGITAAVLYFNRRTREAESATQQLSKSMSDLNKQVEFVEDTFSRVRTENDLLYAVNAITNSLDGPAKDAWVAYATTAIRSIGDVKTAMQTYRAQLGEIFLLQARATLAASRGQLATLASRQGIDISGKEDIDILRQVTRQRTAIEADISSLKQQLANLPMAFDFIPVQWARIIPLQNRINELTTQSEGLGKIIDLLVEISIAQNQIQTYEDMLVPPLTGAMATASDVEEVMSALKSQLEASLELQRKLKPTTGLTKLEEVTFMRDFWMKAWQDAQEAGLISEAAMGEIYKMFAQYDRAVIEAGGKTLDAFERAKASFTQGLAVLDLRAAMEEDFGKGTAEFKEAVIGIWESYRNALYSVITDQSNDLEVRRAASNALNAAVKGLSDARGRLQEALPQLKLEETIRKISDGVSAELARFGSQVEVADPKVISDALKSIIDNALDELARGGLINESQIRELRASFYESYLSGFRIDQGQALLTSIREQIQNLVNRAELEKLDAKQVSEGVRSLINSALVKAMEDGIISLEQAKLFQAALLSEFSNLLLETAISEAIAQQVETALAVGRFTGLDAQGLSDAVKNTVNSALSGLISEGVITEETARALRGALFGRFTDVILQPTPEFVTNIQDSVKGIQDTLNSAFALIDIEARLDPSMTEFDIVSKRLDASRSALTSFLVLANKFPQAFTLFAGVLRGLRINVAELEEQLKALAKSKQLEDVLKDYSSLTRELNVRLGLGLVTQLEAAQEQLKFFESALVEAASAEEQNIELIEFLTQKVKDAKLAVAFFSAELSKGAQISKSLSQSLKGIDFRAAFVGDLTKVEALELKIKATDSAILNLVEAFAQGEMGSVEFTDRLKELKGTLEEVTEASRAARRDALPADVLARFSESVIGENEEERLSNLEAIAKALEAYEAGMRKIGNRIGKDITEQDAMNERLRLTEALYTAIGEATDFAGEGLEEFLDKLLKARFAAADFSEALAVSVESLNLLGQATLAGKISAVDSAIQLLNNAIKKAEEFGDEAAETIARLKAKIEELEKVRGNLQFLDLISEQFSKLGEAAEEAGSVGLATFAKFASKLATEAPTLVLAFNKIREGFAKMAAGTKEGMDDVTGGIASMLNSLTAMVPKFDSTANQIASSILTITGALIGGLIAGPAGAQAGAAIGGFFGAILGDLSNGAEQIRQQVKEVASSARYLSKGIIDAFARENTIYVNRGGIAGYFGATKPVLTEEFNKLTDLAKELVGGLASPMNAAFRNIMTGKQDWKDTLREGLRDGIVEQLFQAMTQGILTSGAFDGFIKTFTEILRSGDINRAFKYLDENFEKVVGGITDKIEEISGKIPDYLKGITGELGDLLDYTEENIKRMLEKVSEAMKSLSESMKRALIDAALIDGKISQEVLNSMLELVKSMSQAFSSGLKDGIIAAIAGDQAWKKILRGDLLATIGNVLIDAFIQQAIVNGIMADFAAGFVAAMQKGGDAATEYLENNVERTINQIENAINTFLGALPDKLREEQRKRYTESGGRRAAGTQIREITGETRDLFIDLLRPLAILPSWTSMIQDIRNDVRFIASRGGLIDLPTVIMGDSMALPSGVGVVNNTNVVIQNATITTQAQSAKELYDDMSKFAFKYSKGGRGK